MVEFRNHRPQWVPAHALISFCYLQRVSLGSHRVVAPTGSRPPASLRVYTTSSEVRMLLDGCAEIAAAIEPLFCAAVESAKP